MKRNGNSFYVLFGTPDNSMCKDKSQLHYERKDRHLRLSLQYLRSPSAAKKKTLPTVASFFLAAPCVRSAAPLNLAL